MRCASLSRLALALTLLQFHSIAAAGDALFFPADLNETTTFDARRSAQLATRGAFDVDYNFSFTDIQPISGITFVHQFVDDAGRTYKAAHYDHGTGIAIADIDGDERLDVYLVSQAGANGLYRNLGEGRFEDITETAGVSLTQEIGVTASFADIDNDGDPDLYVTNVRSPNRLFENLGNGKFKDISDQSGIAYREHSSAAIFFDYDRDGLLDLFLTVVGEYTTNDVRTVSGNGFRDDPPQFYAAHADAFAGHLKPERSRTSRLFRNKGGNTFEDVTKATGLSDDSWSGAATPTDFNKDGWPDLYVLNMQGHDQYWVNDEGRRFTNQSETFLQQTPWGSMGGKVFDYNNDGHMDLLLTDMHSDMSERIGVEREKLKADWITKNWAPSFLRSGGRSIYGNALYRNDGNGAFEEVSDAANVENYWPWGLSVADLNADGWQDVVITASMNYPFRYGPNTVLLNNRGETFLDAAYLLGVEPRRDGRRAKAWFSLDCSGPDARHGHCKDVEGPLIVHGALGSRASAIFDLDADGDLDIVTSEFGDVSQVLLSNLAEKRGNALKYINIHLEGSTSNRDGLGAVVHVTTADARTFVQVNDGQSGYLSQSSMPLYFGLGEISAVEEIRVQWPSGRTTVLTDDIPLNARIEIVEPRG